MRVFIMQRISAIALLVFMTIHMIVVHYPPFHVDFSIILERMANPVWKIIDILFLFFVLMHAVTGAYAVATDYDVVAKFKPAMIVVAWAVSVIAFVWGTMTIWAFQPPV